MRRWATDKSAPPLEMRLIGGAKPQTAGNPRGIFVRLSLCPKTSAYAAFQTTVISAEPLIHFGPVGKAVCPSVNTKELGSSWTDFREILY
jgi:hypothetical protein